MKTVKYPEIDFPIAKPISETTKKEAQLYFDWFMSVMDERIKILTESIQKDINEKWRPDFSKESLGEVGSWLLKHAKNRTVTPEERENEIKEKKLKGLQAELTMEVEEVLTHETILRCFDAGMYVGETLRKNNKWGLHWLYNIAPKRSMTLHEPVLALDKNKFHVCPRRAMQVTASKMIDGTVKGDELFRVLDAWSNIFRPDYKPPHYPG